MTNFPAGLSSRGVPVEGIGSLPLLPNIVYYVDSANGNDNNTGLSPGAGGAFATIEQFLTVDADGDVVIIAPGTYTVASASLPLTPVTNTLFIAGIPAPRPNVIITDDAGGSDTDQWDIEVANVKFVGIEFKAAHNDVARLVKVADTASVDGLTFINCWFDGAGFTTVNGISAIDGTFILTNLYMTYCRFEELNIGLDIGVLGFAGSIVERNFFDMQDAGGGDQGINLADTSALATGYGFVIRDNDFLGAIDAGADSVGIVIAGTENTTAIGILRTNYFAFCALAAITIDKISQSQVNNYVGDVGTGGTLVDPGT